MAPRKKNQSKKKQPAEAAGQAFQRLTAALAAEDRLGPEHVAAVHELQTEATELRAELARLEARLAEVQKEQAQAERAAQGSQRRRGQLGQELEQLKPRLGYEFNMPQDASLAVIGLLGKARCRAAMACQGLRAAVGSAKHLGAFKHRVLALAAGNHVDEDMTYGHTVVCTGDAVLSFGFGVQGQLGYAAASQPTPRVVKALLDEDVVAAAGSERSTLVCTAQGRAYWFGWLGVEDTAIIESKVPRLVGGLERVVGVAAGVDHLLAWTQAGELYTWGAGDAGQLGHGGAEDEQEPKLVEGLAGQQVVGGDGGTCHSVVRTASGRVYTFGSGRVQLGHGQDAAEEQPTPRLVEGLAGSTVVAVAAGNVITAAVTEAGELYTWGEGKEGELGHGEGEENEEVYLPRLVAGLAGKRVAGVAAGGFHTLAWTDSGELYSWGFGASGQLGHNSWQDEWSPRRVEAVAGKAVVEAAAGLAHSMVVTREQKVYTFGNGATGELGHGTGVVTTLVPKEVGGLRV